MEWNIVGEYPRWFRFRTNELYDSISATHRLHMTLGTLGRTEADAFKNRSKPADRLDIKEINPPAEQSKQNESFVSHFPSVIIIVQARYELLEAATLLRTHRDVPTYAHVFGI